MFEELENFAVSITELLTIIIKFDATGLRINIANEGDDVARI